MSSRTDAVVQPLDVLLDGELVHGAENSRGLGIDEGNSVHVGEFDVCGASGSGPRTSPQKPFNNPEDSEGTNK